MTSTVVSILEEHRHRPRRRRTAKLRPWAWLSRHALLLLAVVLPLVLAVAYFGALASDIYVSESRFVVRSQQKPPPTGLGAILQSTGFARAQDDSHLVTDFMLSRDALARLNRELQLEQSWGASTVDRIARFAGIDPDRSFEALYRYYGSRVSVALDTGSAISTLRASSFDPAEAQRVNQRLLEMGESVVNEINARARQDLMRFAEAEVAAAETRAKAAAQALSAYRDRSDVVDPERQAGVQLGQVLKLQEELLATQMQLNQVQALAPLNPQIEPMQRRVRALQSEITTQSARITGGDRSLVGKAAEYQRLSLDREFADRQLAAAMAALETARNDAQRQQLYLERIVQPSLADSPAEPHRIRAVFATLAVGLVAWGVLALLVAGIREHRD